MYETDTELILRRIHLLQTIALAAMLVLLARLWWVQVACGEQFEQSSTNIRTRHIVIQAPRGLILDRNGQVLATTVMQYMVVIDPAEMRLYSDADRALAIERVAHILGMSDGEIQDILDRSGEAGFSSVKLESGVGPAVVTRILEDSDDLPGIDIQRAPVRSYPMGRLACHVLGYVGDVTPHDLSRTIGARYNGADQIGEQGIERYYESELRGIDGDRLIEVNARGAPVSTTDVSRSDPYPGRTLVLTLDSQLQKVAQESFPQGKSGSVVALNVQTGGVLAMASFPGFDPNAFVQDTSEAYRSRIAFLTSSSGPMQNRSVMNRYPPGSIFKPITAAAGFAAGAINLRTMVYCNHGMFIGTHGQWKKCWAFHGWVNFRKAMAESCDVYFYTLMKTLTATRLAVMARAFGLGSPTGIDLPSESRGFIPTPGWKDDSGAGSHWWYGDSCNMAIGQGYIQTTPLQMAVATATLANGGKRMRPYILKEIRSPGGETIEQTQPHIAEIVPVSQADLAQIRDGMRAAVEQGGTAGVVRFQNFEVAAKTGSAQDTANQKSHAWFVCFAPYKNPKIAICVMVEHGGHGGTAAGPVARAMLKEYFHLKEGGGAAGPSD